MKMRSYHCLSALALTASLSEARQWQDIVDLDIYAQPQLDSDRYQLKLELDPFFHVEESKLDVETPTAAPNNQVWFTVSPAPSHSPSGVPSDVPSLAPSGITSEPTSRFENIDGNGGCHEGTFLYRVNMYDEWGDGWHSSTKLSLAGIEDQDTMQISGGTTTRTHVSTNGDMTVSISKTVELSSDTPFGSQVQETKIVDPLGTIFEGQLHRGSHGSAFVCLLPKRCYEVSIDGGDYLDEVSWNIEAVELGSPDAAPVPVIQGGAPVDCSFSIPDEDGAYFCPSQCSTNMHSVNTLAPQLLSHMIPVDQEAVDDSQAHSSPLVVSKQGIDVRAAGNRGSDLLATLRDGDS